MMTPQEISALLQEHGSGHDLDGVDENTEIPDAGRERTQLLSAVLTTCREAWSSQSEELDVIAEKLGDGSRDIAWRIPYGDSGLLEFFLGLLAEGALRQKLHIHSLRLIGNACADTDKNRALVVENDKLSFITQHVKEEALLPFNVPVIYNILVDYEPAQALASKSGLSKQLVNILSLPHISNHAPFVPYICKTLALLVSQEGEAAAADPSTVSILLKLATTPEAMEDVEDFISLLGVAIAYLSNEDFQSRLISDHQVELLLDAFYHAHVGFNVEGIDDKDTATQLQRLRLSLLSSLADISGNDAFTKAYSLSDDIPQSLMTWLKGSNSSLQTAACLALGNLSRNDKESVTLVETYQAHAPLIKLLSNPAVTDTQLLHAACSFLKNLAIPENNKSQLQDLLLPHCLPRIYSLDTLPQIQFAAVSLTRLLLLNCPSNVRQTATPDLDAQQTGANAIISLFGRSDAEPTQLEAARCVASICRALHSYAASEVLPESYHASTSQATEGIFSDQHGEMARVKFYTKHEVEKPLRFLITQKKWPSLRSEAWFVFALLSRSKDGAGIVQSILKDKAAEGVLMETITGEKLEMPNEAEAGVSESSEELTAAASSLQLEPQQVDPKQKASMEKVDRENALILCTELIKNCGADLEAKRLTLLQGLVRDGTQHIVRDRSKAQE